MFTAEQQAEIDRLIDEATSGLKAKNDQLLAEKKKLQKDHAIDPAEVERLESALDTAKAELSRMTKEHKTAIKSAEAATKALEAEQSAVQRLVVDNGLTDALTKAGVTNPTHLKAAKALLNGDIKLEIEGDQRVAKMGSKPLLDAIKEWAAGDEGKHFVAAQANSGGGAAGGGGKGGAAPTMTRAQFDALDPVAKSQTMKSGTVLTEA
jgi:hypothetical protein